MMPSHDIPSYLQCTQRLRWKTT